MARTPSDSFHWSVNGRLGSAPAASAFSISGKSKIQQRLKNRVSLSNQGIVLSFDAKAKSSWKSRRDC